MKKLRSILNQGKTILIVQRIIGVLFILAGLEKFTRYIEDPIKSIEIGYTGNIGTAIEGLSNCVMNNANFLIYFVGVLMLMTGLIEVLNTRYVKLVVILQIAMLLVFVIYFYHAIPQIFIVDGLFLVGLILILRRGNRN